MIFLDFVDFFGSVWTFDFPKLCIKVWGWVYKNEIHVLSTYWVRVDYPMSLYMNFGMCLQMS